MILSAGLTPAWQYILVFDGFRYGEVNRAAEHHRCASGKVLNAGIACHLLGGPSRTLSPVGGLPRSAMEADLADLGVACRWIATQAPTRVCTTLMNRRDGTITELVEDGAPLTSGELAAFRQAYAEEAAAAAISILIGSLPRGTPPEFYRELLSLTPGKAVLDFRGEGLLGCLPLHPFLVKPNREELGQTLQRSLDDDSSLVDAMHELNRRGAQWALVTHGKDAVWLTSTEKVYRFRPRPVEKVINPIGCGDALAAGIAWATRRGDPMVKAVQTGIGAAAANLQQLLPGRFDPSGVEEAARAVTVEELTPR